MLCFKLTHSKIGFLPLFFFGIQIYEFWYIQWPPTTSRIQKFHHLPKCPFVVTPFPPANSSRSTHLLSHCCSVFEKVAWNRTVGVASWHCLPSLSSSWMDVTVGLFRAIMLQCCHPQQTQWAASPSQQQDRREAAHHVPRSWSWRGRGAVHVASRTLQGPLLKRNQVQPITVRKRATHCGKEAWLTPMDTANLTQSTLDLESFLFVHWRFH